MKIQGELSVLILFYCANAKVLHERIPVPYSYFEDSQNVPYAVDVRPTKSFEDVKQPSELEGLKAFTQALGKSEFKNEHLAPPPDVSKIKNGTILQNVDKREQDEKFAQAPSTEDQDPYRLSLLFSQDKDTQENNKNITKTNTSQGTLSVNKLSNISSEEGSQNIKLDVDTFGRINENFKRANENHEEKQSPFSNEDTNLHSPSPAEASVNNVITNKDLTRVSNFTSKLKPNEENANPKSILEESLLALVSSEENKEQPQYANEIKKRTPLTNEENKKPAADEDYFLPLESELADIITNQPITVRSKEGHDYVIGQHISFDDLIKFVSSGCKGSSAVTTRQKDLEEELDEVEAKHLLNYDGTGMEEVVERLNMEAISGLFGTDLITKSAKKIKEKVANILSEISGSKETNDEETKKSAEPENGLKSDNSTLSKQTNTTINLETKSNSDDKDHHQILKPPLRIFNILNDNYTQGEPNEDHQELLEALLRSQRNAEYPDYTTTGIELKQHIVKAMGDLQTTTKAEKAPFIFELVLDPNRDYILIKKGSESAEITNLGCKKFENSKERVGGIETLPITNKYGGKSDKDLEEPSKAKHTKIAEIIILKEEEATNFENSSRNASELTENPKPTNFITIEVLPKVSAKNETMMVRAFGNTTPHYLTENEEILPNDRALNENSAKHNELALKFFNPFTIPKKILSIPRKILSIPRKILSIPRKILSIPKQILNITKCALAFFRIQCKFLKQIFHKYYLNIYTKIVNIFKAFINPPCFVGVNGKGGHMGLNHKKQRSRRRKGLTEDRAAEALALVSALLNRLRYAIPKHQAEDSNVREENDAKPKNTSEFRSRKKRKYVEDAPEHEENSYLKKIHDLNLDELKSAIDRWLALNPVPGDGGWTERHHTIANRENKKMSHKGHHHQPEEETVHDYGGWTEHHHAIPNQQNTKMSHRISSNKKQDHEMEEDAIVPEEEEADQELALRNNLSDEDSSEEILNPYSTAPPDINPAPGAVALAPPKNSQASEGVGLRSFVGDIINSHVYDVIEYGASIFKTFLTNLLSKLFNFGFGRADMILYVGLAMTIGIGAGLLSGVVMLIGTGVIKMMSLDNLPNVITEAITAPFRYLFVDVLAIVNDLNFGVIFKKLYNIMFNIYHRVVGGE